LCKAAIEGLLNAGKRDPTRIEEARTRLEAWRRDAPDDETLKSLLNSLPPPTHEPK
jgi:hypothetical protein